MLRALAILVSVLAVLAPQGSALAAPSRPRPRLTLFITVDAMGAELLQRSRDKMTQGVGPLVTQGAYFPAITYEYPETVTASGHATLSTGANPWRHGIVSNRLYDRNTGRLQTVFSDPERPVLEAPPSATDVSPKAFLAETLADRLRLATREQGKVVSLSGKARSAIAMAGRLGQAWWFHEGVGKFVTGTWYAKEFPTWVKTLNARKLADAYFGKQWTLALPQKAYLGEDDRAFEADAHGLGRTFPHPLTGGLSAPGPEFYEAVAASPFGNELVIEAARAALEGEGLGRDDIPDLLFVNLSALDHVYHLYGPYSWEAQDSMARLDKQIAALVALAERTAGRNQLLVVVTADHGGAAVPEEWTAAGLPGLRLHPKSLTEGLSRELKARFGVDPVLGVDEADIYFNTRVLAEKKLDAAQVRRAAADWLRARPELVSAWTREELEGPRALDGYAEGYRKGFHPQRSGDVFFLLQPYVVLTDEAGGTSHGVPYHHDSDVPLLLRGPGVRRGTFTSGAHPTDVAPTLSALLGIGPPSQSEGRVLGEALLGQ